MYGVVARSSHNSSTPLPLIHRCGSAPCAGWLRGHPVLMNAELPKLHRRRDVLAQGLADHEIRRRYRDGDWQRLRKGVYVDALDSAALDAEARHFLVSRAIIPALSGTAVLSHESAALVHGLPLFGVELGPVHVTQNRRSGGRVTDSVITHCSSLGRSLTVQGLPVTSLARTVVDVARTHPLDTAVVLGDVAMRMGVSEEELAEELEHARRWKGIAAARRAVAFLDARSESVGESLSRIRIRQHGFDNVELQMEIRDRTGKLIARTDFLVASKVVGESDGKAKYVKHLDEGEKPGDVVFKEKQREDAVRDAGYEVVRWTWAELWAFEKVAARLRAAVARAERSPKPSGSVRAGAGVEGRCSRIRQVRGCLPASRCAFGEVVSVCPSPSPSPSPALPATHDGRTHGGCGRRCYVCAIRMLLRRAP